MRDMEKNSALSGIKVLDLSQVLAGPYCAMLLGDMGADVIKVEPPGSGDSTRKSMGIRGKGLDSPGFMALNRNKRSMALDLKSPTGREVFYKLAATADVLIENNRPGASARLGIDYETLSRHNPRLIYASISGFGQTGPWADRPGYDLIAQAMSGVMSAMGILGQEPVKSGISVGDLGAGLFATYGILCALIARQTNGKGQYIDASLFDAALGLSVWEATEYWATAQPPQPMGSANRMSAPYQAVRALDGWFVLGAANQKLWLSLCKMLDRPDLAKDERFRDVKSRMHNRLVLIELLEAVFRTRPVDDWVAALLDAGIPAGPILNYEQVLQSDHVRERQMVLEIDHPVEGKIRTLGFPIKLSGTPQTIRRPPPLLGEHTDEVMAELGLKDRFDTGVNPGGFPEQ